MTVTTGARAGKKNDRRLRPRGSGGVWPVRDGVWRVDVEAPRDPDTAKRRRFSRYVYGTREEAEIALANLRINAAHQRQPVQRSTRRSIRSLFELSAIEDPVERERTLEARREEINEESRSLHRLAMHAFGATLTNLTIGIAGAAWSVGHHNQIGAVLSALSPLVPQPHPHDASAYSFLFSIEKQFGG